MPTQFFQEQVHRAKGGWPALPGTGTLVHLPLSLRERVKLLHLEGQSCLSLQGELLTVDVWLLSRLVLVDSVGTTGREIKGMWGGKRCLLQRTYFPRSLKEECNLTVPIFRAWP